MKQEEYSSISATKRSATPLYTEEKMKLPPSHLGGGIQTNKVYNGPKDILIYES